MSRLHISTRGTCSWRDRLANPDRQWRRLYSALETAVSWENAARGVDGLPGPIAKLLREANYGSPRLLLAVAEHHVELLGGLAASQCDVWGIVKTDVGLLSLSVEAKAREPFGDGTLDQWLVAGGSDRSIQNRRERWEYVREHLPAATYDQVQYQLLHRCAAAVIEARRFGFQHAAFVVQGFNTPDYSFQCFKDFCDAIKLPAARGSMGTTSAAGLTLCVGWADCPLAEDAQLVATV